MEEEWGEDSVREARVWSERGWTAKVVKNPEDDGWAVEMYRAGESEPALVGPWTMGRDKKNPKPLDRQAFLVLVKTAGEFTSRLEQQREQALRKEIVLGRAPERIFVRSRIEPDDEWPRAVWTAWDEFGELLAQKEQPADAKLDEASARRWLDDVL